MLSDFYVGEWGFSALIEADGKKILFDTGSRPNTVIINAKELNLNDKKLEWTANKMEEAGVKYFVGAHCTGVNSTYSIRDNMKLSKKNALVGSVGTYITKDGIYPGYMQ